MTSNYKKLGILLSVNALVMFLLTYSLIDTLDHFYPNLNRIYMAIIMVAPMGALMLLSMDSMYKNKKLNSLLYVVFGVMFLGAFLLARTQTFVGNETFLRSMIPHHSSAIVMCEDSSLTDPKIIQLCEQIVKTQKDEIAQMQTMLQRY